MRRAGPTRRGSVLAGALLACSCVPASEAPPPAGAGGVVTQPSAAARGEPFESGGWTLTVDKLVIRAYVSVSQLDQSSYGGRGGMESYIFDGTRPAEMFTPGVPVGPAQLRLRMDSHYIYTDGNSRYRDTSVGVAPEDVARFATVSDQGFENASGSYRYGWGPSVLFVVKGRRGSSSVTLDVALNTMSFVGTDVNPPVLAIRADQLVLANADVTPERVFDQTIPFDVLAARDLDADGKITGAELRGAMTSPTGPDAGRSTRETLLDALARRLGNALVSLRP